MIWADYTGALAQYNARIVELAQTNYCALADFYTTMYGHPEYYAAAYHPGNAGHAAMAQVIEGLIPSLAGGDLLGTWPNPVLVPVNANTGTFGDSTHVAQVTLDAKGRVISCASVGISASGLTPGTVGQILQTSAGPVVAWTTMSQDGVINGTGELTVQGISGIPISGTPVSGQSLVFNGTSWVPTTPSSGGTNLDKVLFYPDGRMVVYPDGNYAMIPA